MSVISVLNVCFASPPAGLIDRTAEPPAKSGMMPKSTKVIYYQQLTDTLTDTLPDTLTDTLTATLNSRVPGRLLDTLAGWVFCFPLPCTARRSQEGAGAENAGRVGLPLRRE